MSAEEEKVTLSDYLQEMDRVDSIVGAASDSADCTYARGSLPRQAVYACLTCAPPDKGLRAGFCYACSLHCHHDHVTEEIYTKRNFRCDCGTVPQLLCTLKPEVDTPNTENAYSQNFVGKYCSCSKPYPDPTAPELDDVEMLQCLVCEDWFHATHLDSTVPELYQEMVCAGCVEGAPWLEVYSIPQPLELDVEGGGENPGVKTANRVKETNEVDLDNNEVKNGDLPASTDVSASHSDSVVPVDGNPSDAKVEADNIEAGNKREATNSSTELNHSPKRKKTNDCKLFGREVTPTTPAQPLFFLETFRTDICKCSSCLDLYTSHKLPFLADPQDSLQHYESEAEHKRQEDEDSIAQQFEGLPHAAKCKAARAIASLTSTIGSVMERIGRDGGEVDRDAIMQAFKDEAVKNGIDPSNFDRR